VTKIIQLLLYFIIADVLSNDLSDLVYSYVINEVRGEKNKNINIQLYTANN